MNFKFNFLFGSKTPQFDVASSSAFVPMDVVFVVDSSNTIPMDVHSIV
jgi:hypothetical protein